MMKVKNVFKDSAAKVMQWQALDNADTGDTRADFTRLYAIPYLLLFVVASAAGIFAGFFDWQVLANLEASTANGAAPTLWPFLIALILQIVIYAGGAPLAKAAANRLYKKDKHKTIIYFLAPLVAAALFCSVVISSMTITAERKNIEDYAKNKKAELLTQQEETHKAAAIVAAKIDSSSASDKKQIIQQTQSQAAAMASAHAAKLAEYKASAKKYRANPAKWSQATAQRYERDSTAKERSRYAAAVECLKIAENKHIQGITTAAATVKTATSRADSVYSVQLAELNTMETSGAAGDFMSAAKFKKWRNIVFSLLSLVILYGLHNYYKRVNQLSDLTTAADKDRQKDTDPDDIDPDDRNADSAAETIDAAAARQIQIIKDRIRVQFSRSKSSAEDVTRQTNQIKAEYHAQQLRDKFGIETEFLSNGKVNFL